MLLTQLTNLYFNSAKELFFTQLPEARSARTYINVNVVETSGLSARCNSVEEDDGSRINISVSVGCLENLTADIDLDDESQNAFYEWRLSWLAWHELAHWAYGHINVYREAGWITDLGIAEEHQANELRGFSEDLESMDDGGNILAHAAELEADAFATRKLYDLMVRTPVSDDHHGNTPDEDIQFCYYTIMTAVCCFFAHSNGSGRGLFHPSWNVRALNVFVTLFRMHLERRNMTTVAKIGQRTTRLVEQAQYFMSYAIQPTIDGIEDYGRSIGCPLLVHGENDNSLFDPSCLLDVFTGERQNHIVDEYLHILRKQPELVSRSEHFRVSNEIQVSKTVVSP